MDELDNMVAGLAPVAQVGEEVPSEEDLLSFLETTPVETQDSLGQSATRDKNNLIDHLEVGLCNDIINKGVKCGVLFQVKKMFNNGNNPTSDYGCYSGIIKKNNFYQPNLKDSLLHLNHNELFLIVVFLLKKVGPNSSITVDLLKKIS